MERPTSDEICKLIDFLIGETEPWADTRIDGIRAENLHILISVTDSLVYRLYQTAKYQNSPYYSSRAIGKSAYSAMMNLKTQCEELEREVGE